jgi:hypothetical protein
MRKITYTWGDIVQATISGAISDSSLIVGALVQDTRKQDSYRRATLIILLARDARYAIRNYEASVESIGRICRVK